MLLISKRKGSSVRRLRLGLPVRRLESDWCGIRQLRGQQRNCGTFVLAGMGPSDFFLYAREVERIKPRDVVLYLSDFDLGNQPSMIGAKLAPPQSGRRIIELLQILRSYPTAISFTEKQDFVISQAVPQYRYQYIFRGLLDKLVRKKKGFPEADVTAKSDEESFERQLKDFATRER